MYFKSTLSMVFAVGVFIVSPVYAETDAQLFKKGQWRDPATGLEWMRCSIGQTWTGTSCDGEGKRMNWNDAMKAGNDLSYGGVTGWRLPTFDELKTIIVIEGKADNASAFIFKPTSDYWGEYWSSSPMADVFYHALIINFDHNAIGTYRKDTNCYVRLVRTGQQE